MFYFDALVTFQAGVGPLNPTRTHLTTFEFGGHANLGGLTLLDIRTSLDSPIYFLGRFSITICCIFEH